MVLSPQNLWLGNINFNDNYDIGIVSPSYKTFNIKKEFCKEFIANILLKERMLYEYKNASAQGASVVRRNLDMRLFYKISIKIPTKEEQNKIANIINTINTNIGLQKQKLNKLKLQQKTLMQLLLTGIVRVKMD